MQIEVLGERYQLQDTIGRGGMAVIYRGRDLRMDRPVAIKVLREAYSTDPKFVTRFQLEAKAASSLQHPNIVQVYDYGYTDGSYFIVMELVDGSDLRRYLRSRRVLDVERAMIIAHDVAMGLGAAHRRNIVHRDVKPQNILIGRDGSIKLTDFGIASVYNDMNAERLTTTGMTLGTVQYYAPEQAQGEIVTPAADVYALGIVMYEMLTGRTPFEGDTPVAVAMQHLQDAPLPPSNINPNIPAPLEDVILRCLEKVPEMRFRDGNVLAKTLEQLGEMQTGRGLPPTISSGGSPSGVNQSPIPPRPSVSRPDRSSGGQGALSSSPNHQFPPTPATFNPPGNGTYAAPTIAEVSAPVEPGQPYAGYPLAPDGVGSGSTRPFDRGTLARSGVVQEQRESRFASIITVLILLATLLLLGFSIYLAYMLGFLSFGSHSPTPNANSVVVPNLIGDTKSQALATAHNHQLNINFVNQGDCVIQQGTKPGDIEQAGSYISVTLGSCSTATPTVQPTMPDLTNQPLSNALTTLQKLGINSEVYKDAGTNGALGPNTVIRTDPAAGASLQTGQTVTLYIANCSASVCLVNGVTPTVTPTKTAPSPTPTSTPPTPTPTSAPPTPTPTNSPPTPTPTNPPPTPTPTSILPLPSPT
jgi:serine/threonine protein kinase/beta-lactam-binding protein with PASTA domain